jgi:hypothetical protein
MAKNHQTTQASSYLKEQHGITCAPRTLQDMRASGVGPRYVRDGNRVLYPEPELDAWANARLGKPVRSTSEEAARRQRATV